MTMVHRLMPVLPAALLVLGVACSTDSPEKLYETARFEEKQFNTAHARQLYAEILDCCPDSPWAKKARQRLAALETNGD
jgi:TolA-binding protein